MDRAPAAPAGVPPDLEGHPDRLKWNARYRHLFAARFTPHPLAVAALALPLPAGPVLDLASGPSGSALAAAAGQVQRSEEHTSELQSHVNLVCRLLLAKTKRAA